MSPHVLTVLENAGEQSLGFRPPREGLLKSSSHLQIQNSPWNNPSPRQDMLLEGPQGLLQRYSWMGIRTPHYTIPLLYFSLLSK